MNVVDTLARAGRRLVEAGLSPGSTGNISGRVGDRIFLSGTGAQLGRLTTSDFAQLTPDGDHLGGPKASKEAPLHLSFYQRDREHGAVVHVHSPHAVALSCCAPWADHSAVPPLTPYFVMRVGQTPLLPYHHPGDERLGQDLLRAPWRMRAALLANHGSVVAGSDVDEAVERAIELEEACRIAITTAGLPRRLLPPDEVAELAHRWGAPWTEARRLVGED